jgi:superfamily II DNA or RNA helicase
MGKPITIKIDNVWGQVAERLPTDILTYVGEKTRYHPKGYDKSWNFKKKRWDGYNYTINFETQAFRVGILDRIVMALKFHQYEPVIEFIGEAAPTLTTAATMPDGVVRPYEFQQKVRPLVREYKRGIIASPTGSGKTVMAGLMIDELKRRTLVILNDLVLLDQMARSLGRQFPGVTIGYIGDQEFELGDITVATVQSLRSILGIIESKKKKSVQKSENKAQLEEWLKDVGVILHDEAHLADAESCVLLYTLFSRCDRIYGFSATPYDWAEKRSKLTNIELEQVFGHVIYNTFDIDFIELNLKVPLIVKSVEVPVRMQTYGTFRDNQAELYKKALNFEILNNEAWFKAVFEQVEECKSNQQTVFVYASHSLDYGGRLANMLGAPFVQGKTPRKERFQYFNDLQDKKIPVVVSDIGSVGLDIPSLDAFLLASDVIDVRQMMGRVARGYPGKTAGHFIDLWKDCSFLRTHRKTRLNQYTHDGHLVL